MHDMSQKGELAPIEVFQCLRHPSDLDAWEPRSGYAILTCKIDVGNGWEPRTYEFLRTTDGWTINTTPRHLQRLSWDDCVRWLCRMQPIDIELITTV